MVSQALTGRRWVANVKSTPLARCRHSAYSTSMSWDAKDVALLKKLWSQGQSAAQIARRLGYSRNAVCAKLTRLDLKRGHKPPTAKPRIRSEPKRIPALAACAQPVARMVSRKKPTKQPKEFSKGQLYAILAEAVRNTG